MENKTQKPLKAKPYFYSCCLAELQKISVSHGYNLLIHGSLQRDMDLVAVPWVDSPSSHYDLLVAFCEYLGVPLYKEAEDFMYSVLPGGRHSYIINLNRGGKYNNYLDEEYYLDISITPLIINF